MGNKLSTLIDLVKHLPENACTKPLISLEKMREATTAKKCPQGIRGHGR
jgi:hypothetical protein